MCTCCVYKLQLNESWIQQVHKCNCNVNTHVCTCMHIGGGGDSLPSVSPTKRTISSTSSDVLMSLPALSVSSMDLASYVHHLRSHLPKASAPIDGRPPDGGMAERARAEMDREASSRSLGSESYAAEFMDRSLTSRWDKQKPKVYLHLY